MPTYRPLSEWERRLVLRLLSIAFPGRDELLIQLQDAVCTTLREDGGHLENGSLFFRTTSPTMASVKKGVPTEGEAKDADGITIHYLLHVYQGRIGGLEVFKEDFSKVLRHAEPDELQVTVAG